MINQRESINPKGQYITITPCNNIYVCLVFGKGGRKRTLSRYNLFCDRASCKIANEGRFREAKGGGCRGRKQIRIMFLAFKIRRRSVTEIPRFSKTLRSHLSGKISLSFSSSTFVKMTFFNEVIRQFLFRPFPLAKKKNVLFCFWNFFFYE